MIPIIRLAASRRVEAIATNGGNVSRPTQRMHHAFPSGAYSTDIPEVCSINSRVARRSPDNLSSSAVNRTNSSGFFFGFLSPVRSVDSLPGGSLPVGSSVIHCQSFTFSQVVGFKARIDPREHRENECRSHNTAHDPHRCTSVPHTYILQYLLHLLRNSKMRHHIYTGTAHCVAPSNRTHSYLQRYTLPTLQNRGASASRLDMQKYATEKAL